MSARDRQTVIITDTVMSGMARVKSPAVLMSVVTSLLRDSEAEWFKCVTLMKGIINDIGLRHNKFD